ncbi:hypothetical protein AKJ65_04695 [candidate division MSBL1 archaeon SCGC-AAA259E19]|uniref:Uncharacterized protein n=1 Tax=candidate division MSBL1 archaeon SCGC-AAA259E19 TaxID=1698264 RepID=A0A133UJF7_9EURY|nr:hypothetical protein AKJ65_04695 [candidate division MSBL1 archaeon SCGC-AAA259E19]
MLPIRTVDKAKPDFESGEAESCPNHLGIGTAFENPEKVFGMSDDTTTITIDKENWRKLNRMKRDPSDTLNDVLTQLLEEAEGADEE